MALIWEAAHAGTCYPRTPKAIHESFRKTLEVPDEESNPGPAPGREVFAWIIPHIDFRVDLTTYACVYRHIARLRAFPETVYILGVGHQCPHDFSLCPGSFATPLGTVESDRAVAEEITRSTRIDAARSPETFQGEHSLEFVVIWLQALRDLYFPGKNFRVVPVLLGGLPEAVIAAKPPGPRSDFHRFGKALHESLRQRHSSSLVIASIDGCHVGPRFDHEFPADEGIQQSVWNWEDELWHFCQTPELPGLYRHLGHIRNGFYFDGVGALTLLLQHHPLEARIFSRKLWFQEADQSFVTFSAGCLHPI